MWRRAAAFLIDLIPLAMIAVVQHLPEFPDNEVVGFAQPGFAGGLLRGDGLSVW
jgi:hypothetical protein